MKKLIFVIVIDVDEKHESSIRTALEYVKTKVETLFKGHAKIDEVKLEN